MDSFKANTFQDLKGLGFGQTQQFFRFETQKKLHVLVLKPDFYPLKISGLNIIFYCLNKCDFKPEK